MELFTGCHMGNAFCKNLQHIQLSLSLCNVRSLYKYTMSLLNLLNYILPPTSMFYVHVKISWFTHYRVDLNKNHAILQNRKIELWFFLTFAIQNPNIKSIWSLKFWHHSPKILQNNKEHFNFQVTNAQTALTQFIPKLIG